MQSGVNVIKMASKGVHALIKNKHSMWNIYIYA